MKSQTFSFARVAAIIMRHATMNLKSYLIAFGATADVLLVILFAILYKQHAMDTDAFTSVTSPAVFIGGLVFTSLIFKEIHHPLRSHAFLMLPASTAEKLTAYWLLSSVGFLTACIGIMYIINFILAAAGYFILDVPFFIVNLFTFSAMKFYVSYMVFHSLFLLGAVIFRNLNFLKTIIAAITASIIIGLLTALFIYRLFRNETGPEGNFNFSLITTDFSYTSLPCALTIAFVAALLAATYYKLKEKQV